MYPCTGLRTSYQRHGRAYMDEWITCHIRRREVVNKQQAHRPCGSQLHSCFKCHGEHQHYPVPPLTRVFSMKFHYRQHYSMQASTDYQGRPRRFRKTSLFGSTPACVCTGFHCVICLRYDQTCTLGHRPAIQESGP